MKRIKHKFYASDYAFYIDNNVVTGGVVGKVIPNSETETVSYAVNGRIFKESQLFETRIDAELANCKTL